jgi:hypothetical protein
VDVTCGSSDDLVGLFMRIELDMVLDEKGQQTTSINNEVNSSIRASHNIK